MSDLIKALQILLKYGDPHFPTDCGNDCLYICGIDPHDVDSDDIDTLDTLGFFVDKRVQEFASYRYGAG